MIEFGKRNAPPKPKTGHEALRPPTLNAQVIHDTLHNITTGEFHNDLKTAIDTDPDIRARANEIATLVAQGRSHAVTTESLKALTAALEISRKRRM